MSGHTTARFTWPERVLVAGVALGAVGTLGLFALELAAGDLTTIRDRTMTLAVDGLVIWVVWLAADLRATRRRVAALQGRALTEQWGPR